MGQARISVQVLVVVWLEILNSSELCVCVCVYVYVCVCVGGGTGVWMGVYMAEQTVHRLLDNNTSKNSTTTSNRARPKLSREDQVLSHNPQMHSTRFFKSE